MRKPFVVLGVCFALGCSGATGPSGEGRLPPAHSIVPSFETPETTPPATPTPSATPAPTPPERLTTELPHGEPPAVTPVPTATPADGTTGSTGSVDESFGKNGHFGEFYSIDSIEEESDGAILFTGWHDGPGFKVCRLTAEGNPDLSFGSSAGCTSIELGTVDCSGTQVLSHAGRIYAAGVGSAGFVLRLFPDGVLDTSFGVDGIVTLPGRIRPGELALDGDALLVSGSGSGFGVLLRLSADGDLDTNFGIDGVAYLENPLYDAPAIVRLSDGWWIAAGHRKIFAFDPHGARSTTFGEGGALTLPFSIHALSADAKGALLAAGEGMEVARFSTTGALLADYPALEPGYSSDGEPRRAYARDLWVEGDGTMIMGGGDSTDDSELGIGRRLPDGSPDLSFGTGGARPYVVFAGGIAIIVLHDGRYLIAGTADGSAGILLRVWN